MSAPLILLSEIKPSQLASPQKRSYSFKMLTPSTAQKFRSSDQDYICSQIYKVLLNGTLSTVTVMPIPIPWLEIYETTGTLNIRREEQCTKMKSWYASFSISVPPQNKTPTISRTNVVHTPTGAKKNGAVDWTFHSTDILHSHILYCFISIGNGRKSKNTVSHWSSASNKSSKII